MSFVEQKRTVQKCPGGAFHRLGKLPMEEYMGRFNGAQSWIRLTGAAAKPCEELKYLRMPRSGAPPPPHLASEGMANGTGGMALPGVAPARAVPLDPAVPAAALPAAVGGGIEPLPSGWEPSAASRGPVPNNRSRAAQELTALSLLHHREAQLGVVAARGFVAGGAPSRASDPAATTTAMPAATTAMSAAAAVATPAADAVAATSRLPAASAPHVISAFASAAVRPPRVFLYKNPHLEAFFKARSEAEAADWAFGKPIGDGYRATDTWALSAMLLYKLHYLRRGWLTERAEEADLFLIPLLPRKPSYGTAAKYGDDFRFETAGMCDHLYKEDLAAAYAHLTPESAARHVVVAVDYTPILGFCSLHGGAYGARPTSFKLLRRMRWMAHEDFGLAEVPAPASYFSHAHVSSGAHGGGLAINAPFPSAVHSVTDLQRFVRSERRLLLGFAGSLNGSPTGKALRVSIAEQCRFAGEPACGIIEIKPGQSLGSEAIVDVYAHMRNATFCAEPGGHNKIRKGVVDAVLNGCIPIVFLEADELRKLWPHHLFGWRDAIVNLRPSEVLGANGEAKPSFDLIAHLRAIPASRVEAMQRLIAEHGRRLAYLSSGAYEGEDAADILLKGLAFGLPGR